MATNFSSKHPNQINMAFYRKSSIDYFKQNS